MNSSGVAETSVSFSARLLVKAVSTIFSNVSAGEWPVAARTTLITPTATTSDPAGTANVSQRG